MSLRRSACAALRCRRLSYVLSPPLLPPPIVELEPAYLASFLGQCPSLNAALPALHAAILRRVPAGEEDSLSPWNAAIIALSSLGAHSHALDLYRRMPTRPDHLTIPLVLKSSAHLRLVPSGTSAHRRAIELGFLLDPFVSNSLIAFYGKCGRFDEAMKVFDEMPHRNLVSWSVIIGACAQNGHPKMALSLFDQILEEGFRPNRPTFLNVMPCVDKAEDADKMCQLIERQGLDSELVIRNAVVGMYARCERIEFARKLFDGILGKDLVSWSTMIEAYRHANMFTKALEVLREMRLHSVAPDHVVVLGIIRVCANATLVSLRQARFVHGFAVRSSFRQNLIVDTALIDMYIKRGSLVSARRVFDCMRDRNLVSWSTMISGYGMHGLGKEALELFYQMKGMMKLDHIVLVSVLSACSHAGLINEGWQCFNSMVSEFGLVPRAEHYACMVDLLGRAGQLREALEFIERMPIKPDASVWGSLLGACRIHPNLELAELAARSLFELDPENSGRYMCLSNVYISLGKIDEANKIRAFMKQRGVKKTIGYTVIEVKNKVYKFRVGDRSNPQAELIYKELERLMHRIRDEGYVPNTNFALHDVEEETKEKALFVHSEKLAIVFGLLNSGPEGEIQIHKNLRVCGDCHTATKFVSKVTGRKIIVRDSHRFHHFNNGVCSCGDYW